MAKNAQIVLVASFPTSATDDNLFDSESYIVNNVNTLNARIMNVSYGECELGMGTAGNVEYYNLWQTAASEGIAVFVATGDSGSPSCDQGGDSSGVPAPAEYGLTVSGIASTPYNTAVGGTDFNWCPLNSTDACATEAAPYWGTSNSTTNKSNALKYVPEVPWNDTCTSPLALPFMKTFFSGITYSGSGNQTYSVTDAETGCNALGYYAQTLSNDGDGVLLYLVDTVGGGGGASNCVVSTSTTTTDTCTTGATSTGATKIPSGATIPSINLTNNGWQKPSWQAGVTGIVNDGVRDIPDVSFFASDGFLSSSAYLICVSQVAACSYSSATEPVSQEVGGTSVATPAMAGIMALINQKLGSAQGSPNAELYALAAKQTYSGCSAETVSNSSNCYFNDIDTSTNAMVCDYSASVTTPSPNCAIAHPGDYYGILTGFSATTGYDEATGLGSLNVANVVNAWPAVSGGTPVTVTVTPAQSSLSSTQALGVTGAVASNPAGGVTPTGTVKLTAGSYTSTATLTSGGYSFTIPANSLGAGTDTINVAYGGNTTYSTGDGSATVTANGTGATFSLTPGTVSSSSVTPGASATETGAVAAGAGYVGSVSLTCQQSSTTATGSDGASCVVTSGSPVTLSSGTTTGTVTFTIGTSAKVGALSYPKVNDRRNGWGGLGGGAVLALLVFFGIPARRKSWRAMLGLLVLIAALGSLSACGGGGGGSSGGSGGSSDPGTTAGTYTFLVQATGNPAVSPSVSTSFTVTVN